MKKFQRTVEDFICQHCGAEVIGNGYTNHCPECLHSKHVDTSPGDRESPCLGLMIPVRVEVKDGHERIVHQCVVCGHQMVNKVQKEDNRETLYALSRKSAEKQTGFR